MSCHPCCTANDLSHVTEHNQMTCNYIIPFFNYFHFCNPPRPGCVLAARAELELNFFLKRGEGEKEGGKKNQSSEREGAGPAPRGSTLCCVFT